MRRLGAASIAALAVAMTWSADAAAEPIIAPGVHGQVAFYGSSRVAAGGSASLLVGYNTENEPILIVPHVVGSFGYVAGDFEGIYGRALAGLKFGAALSYNHALITRVGYGHYRLPENGVLEAQHGAALQAGYSFDHRLSRTMTIGAEALYDLFIIEPGVAHGILLGLTLGFGL